MLVILITTVRMRVIGDNDTKVAAEDKYGDDIVMKTIMTIITKLMTITRVVVMLIDEENSDMLSISMITCITSNPANTLLMLATICLQRILRTNQPRVVYQCTTGRDCKWFSQHSEVQLPLSMLICFLGLFAYGVP